MQPIRRRIDIQGVIQGVGFRPLVWRLATELNLTGWIANGPAGVEVEIQGSEPNLQCFLERLGNELPPQASISQLEQTDIAPVIGESAFEIRASGSGRVKQAMVPPDLALCADCERELFDPQDRRYQYPFINCTNCGPRFTILLDLPYDRHQTTMGRFTMCAECQAEYDGPRDRRFHAQPNACSTCGPQVWFTRREHLTNLPTDALDESCREFDAHRVARGQAAIQLAREAIERGDIVAIKGVGGFHLACDARNQQAVQKLRERKGRHAKPLAIMVADLDTAGHLAEITAEASHWLTSPQRPIVLVRKREPCPLAAGIAPDNPQLGIMLAYSPLHRLLVRPGDVWVMTSGNLSEEPICRTNAEARERLSPIADAFVFHNRPIAAVCDDSVIRGSKSQPIPIRRSRGFCPLPIPIRTERSDVPLPSVLAVGGELKAAICLTVGAQAIMGQHIGDTANLETLEALQRSVEHLVRLYGVAPQAVVVDAHPGYLSAAWGRRQAARWGIPVHAVQHHHAHAAAIACEHGSLDEPIIAVVFDGTGYGTDGAIWGGEWLIASGQNCERFAQLAYTPLPGGDASIECPARTALAQLFHYGLPWAEGLAPVAWFSPQELRLLVQQLERNVNCVPTSSMGRLFDAVASLCGLKQRVDYEAEAASLLEFQAMLAIEQATQPIEPYPVELRSGPCWQWHHGPALAAIVADCQSGTPRPLIAARFHRTVAVATRQLCEQARAARGIDRVGLTGGVFQNALLRDLVADELHRFGFRVLTHTCVPPNDGGLALGQAVIGQRLVADALAATIRTAGEGGAT